VLDGARHARPETTGRENYLDFAGDADPGPWFPQRRLGNVSDVTVEHEREWLEAVAQRARERGVDTALWHFNQGSWSKLGIKSRVQQARLRSLLAGAHPHNEGQQGEQWERRLRGSVVDTRVV